MHWSFLTVAGTLSIDTEVSIEEGASLASPDFATTLALPSSNPITAAGPAVIVGTSPAVNPAMPFTLALPVTSGSALALNSVNYAVIYHSYDANSKKTYRGIIHQSECKLDGDTIVIKSSYFGAYRVVITSSPVTSSVVQEVTEVLWRQRVRPTWARARHHHG